MNPFVQTVARLHGRFEDVCEMYKPSTQEKHLSYCRVSGTEREWDRVERHAERVLKRGEALFHLCCDGGSVALCTFSGIFNAFNNRVATSTDDPCVFPPVFVRVCVCACARVFCLASRAMGNVNTTCCLCNLAHPANCVRCVRPPGLLEDTLKVDLSPCAAGDE